eukprot:gnl/Chilomastix_cuspidata/759.p1 GENE.gnl/Chilomastix_cuspidata/759~~gnl/Chilomastix_cuspidata/759.p1  ORF type:complete len:329 (+),score=117.65 gnl/Chilomastix_cuspidata/759:3-989(+)
MFEKRKHFGMEDDSPRMLPLLEHFGPDLAPLLVGIMFVIALVTTGALSFATNNFSQVDRLWSVFPVIYAFLIFFTLHLNEVVSPKLSVMAALITVWGTRLTYNFYRRGGYAPGFEDHRWTYIRARWPAPRCLFAPFMLLFCIGYQNALILAICFPLFAVERQALADAAAGAAAVCPAPLAAAARAMGSLYRAPVISCRWGVLDTLALALFIAFFVLEATADKQRSRFYAQRPRTARVLTTGLFALCRHPNFVGEMGMWCSIALFAAGTAPHKVVFGPALMLVLLFQGSTWITEKISAERHGEEFLAYKRTTPRLLPLGALRRRTGKAD